MSAGSSRVLTLLSERLVHGPGTTYLVGGALRDLLLSRQARDIDLLVEGRAEAERFALAALEDLSGMHPVLFDRRLPHTHRVVIDGVIVDSSFCPPDGVAVELRRRDFTVNAMAAPLGPLGAIIDPARPEGAPAAHGIAGRVRPLLVDPTGGLGDLAGRRLREEGIEQTEILHEAQGGSRSRRFQDEGHLGAEPLGRGVRHAPGQGPDPAHQRIVEREPLEGFSLDDSLVG
ncbi:MAG TPA: hypothetical protein VNI57_01615, partial [Candidatus Saccharimonadales bacterium]|nr:hypothetical protein [Candidatus Saccharimonadales bacterium]